MCFPKGIFDLMAYMFLRKNIIGRLMILIVTHGLAMIVNIAQRAQALMIGTINGSSMKITVLAVGDSPFTYTL